MKIMEQETREWLPLRGAIALCQKHGRNITDYGLIYAGKELNFIRKCPDGFHWEYEKSGILKWLKETAPPDGWITMNAFADQVDITIQKAYYILRKYKLERKKYGKIGGVYHVREKDAIEGFRKHKESYYGR